MTHALGRFGAADEIVAMAKHYPNAWVDMCWAWSINPRHAGDFVRRFIHAAPVNKLFGFGGDTKRPRASVAYAQQARTGLTRALQAELSFYGQVFGFIEGRRAAIRERLAARPDADHARPMPDARPRGIGLVRADSAASGTAPPCPGPKTPRSERK